MLLWYTARGAGLSALVLLTVATALGAIVSARRAESMSALERRTVLQYVHRAAAGAGLAVLILHVATILLDSYANVGVTGAIVPFTSSYRATAVGLGTIAAYLLILTALVGLVRARFAASERGARVWRWLHGAGYTSWGVAITHGYLAGSDADTVWMQALLVACLALVGGAVAYRVFADTRIELARHRPWGDTRAVAGPGPVRPTRATGVTR